MTNSFSADKREMFMTALADELDGTQDEGAFKYCILAHLFPSDRPLYWTFEHNAIDESALGKFAEKKGYKVIPNFVDIRSEKFVLFQKI